MSSEHIQKNNPNDALLINIQFLRFVAASFVLLFHFTPGFYIVMHTPFNERTHIASMGFAGIDILFVISGFIIYYAGNKILTTKESFVFIASRLARVYLGYWPFFFIAIAVFYHLRPDTLNGVDFVNSFFLLPTNYDDILIKVSWTLSFELYFYFIFFIILFFEKRIQIIIGLFLLILFFNIYTRYNPDAFNWYNYKNFGYYQQLLMSPWLLEFFFGCAVAHLIKSGHQKYAITLFILGIIIFAFACFLNVTSLRGGLDLPTNQLHRILLFSGGASCIIYGLVNFEKRGWIIFQRFSILFGGATYALYLCHTLFLRGLWYSGAYAHLASLPIPPAFIFLLIIILIQVFAAVFYQYIEHPVYKYAKMKIRAIASIQTRR